MRHDLDPHQSDLAGFGQQPAGLPASQPKLVGNIAHGEVKLIVPLGDLDHQLLALLGRQIAELDIAFEAISLHRLCLPAGGWPDAATRG